MLPSLRERNTQFDSMTPAEQRVAVAKDVIEQVQAGLLVSLPRTYIEVNTSYNSEGVLIDSCSVCALGATAISAFDGEACEAYRANTNGDVWLRRLLEDIFPLEMLLHMEAYFEGGNAIWSGEGEFLHLFESDNELNYVFAWNYPVFLTSTEETRKQHLISVFQHIVENNGEWNTKLMGGVEIYPEWNEEDGEDSGGDNEDGEDYSD